MDLIDKIDQLSNRILSLKDNLETEEATKMSLIMPFLQTLGYDVFNPLEVIPEFTADIGSKRGEKVDYAIMHDNKPTIFIECKKVGAVLSADQETQLQRYYNATEARIAILTDGITYKFYSDLERDNVMDGRPFFEFDLSDYEEAEIQELKKFSKTTFDLDNVLSTANDLKYSRAIIANLNSEFAEPSEEFLRFWISKVYEGQKNKKVMEQLTPVAKRALSQFINDKVKEKLNQALNSPDSQEQGEPEAVAPETQEDSRIITTEEELEGYHIVKAILRQVVDPNRIIHRDTQSYFGILLDDNNRKPICRLRFNASQKYVGTFNSSKNEEKFPIANLNDIYGLSDKLIESVKGYLPEHPQEM